MNAISNRPSRVLKIAATMFPLVAFAGAAQADIFQWEYINPADPIQGKQQSTTLAPDGAGVDAVPGAYLDGRDLTMAYLIGADLTDANFGAATLTDAIFRDANLANAVFVGSDCGLDDCYPSFATLIDADFSHANLTNVHFGASNLTGANFRQANLANARITFAPCFYCLPFPIRARLAGADLTAADVRGADVSKFAPSSATTTNLIRPSGHIDGLGLDAGGLLVVRDHDGYPGGYDEFGYRDPIPPIPINVGRHLAMIAGGTLRMVFEADAWDSMISFAPGIPVTLGGTLELTFAADVNLASQVGRTFDLFDWTGVNPTGAFAISSPYAWNLSNLYTTGEVTLTAIPEPTSAALVLLAAGAMFVARRTRLCAGLMTPHRSSTAGLLVSLSPLLLVSPSPAHADIYQWEYINPLDPSQGKQQSTTLAPDGAGVDAVPGANLIGLNLTMAYLIGADLTGAAFANGANLRKADLSHADLADANFWGTTLTDAEFTNAEVQGAFFGKEILCSQLRCSGGITLAQLYSTASYLAHDLTGINLFSNDLAGGNFAGQNLTNASFFLATLTDADFRHANLTNASFAATLTDADFTAADARGAFLDAPTSAITINLIRPDGHIDGLDLAAGGLLVVRDYHAPLHDPLRRIPITVDRHLTMGPGGTLRMVFEADAWDSMISFAPGIPVTLGGTLELTFAADVNLASQVGRTFDLFDWTGVNPTGAFAISSPYAWNLSNLYTTGEVTLTAIPEPTSAALVLLAAGAMFVARRTRLCAGLMTPHRSSTAGLLVSLSPLLLVSPSPAHADIYQWEYINPLDPSQGKQQSTTLAPDGAGVDAVPGVRLRGRDLTMAYLIGADLTATDGILTNLTNADLSETNLTYARFLSATLTGANLSQANLAFANLGPGSVCCFTQGSEGDGIQRVPGANLTDANFAGARVQGASFGRSSFDDGGTGISLAQLYSTASYQTLDLSGIGLGGNDLTGANFAGQNLANSIFSNPVASVRDGRVIFNWYDPTWLNGADFTSADTRGARFLDVSSAMTTNLILPDGHIKGLDLDAGGLLVVRDYDGDPTRFPTPLAPIGITVDQQLTMAPGGALRMVFEADAWDSTISFAPGIPVTLGGTLELTFAADVNLASQVGRTFDLFDWTGVTPAGAFTVTSPYAWDLSNLYTTGEVTLTAIPEPATVVLLALAAGKCFKRRRTIVFVS